MYSSPLGICPFSALALPSAAAIPVPEAVVEEEAEACRRYTIAGLLCWVHVHECETHPDKDGKTEWLEVWASCSEKVGISKTKATKCARRVGDAFAHELYIAHTFKEGNECGS